MPVCVAVIDSGIAPHGALPVTAASAFVRSPRGEMQHCAARADVLGHGSAIATLIATRAPQAELLDAQVFTAQQAVDAGVLAAAIDWSVAQGARLLNLSVGLLVDREPLRVACARAVAAGVSVIAATPARGRPSFPAAYPQVIAVCGDARCAEHQWAMLDDAWQMGASPLAPSKLPGGGASFAAARLCGFAADFFCRQANAGQNELLAHLRSQAAHHGREHRT